MGRDGAAWLADYLRAGARHVVVRIGALDANAHLDALAAPLLPLRDARETTEEPIAWTRSEA